jgi:hypothetical protein
MATLDYPIDELFLGAQYDFGLTSNTWVFRSPISQAAQTVGMPGSRWRAKVMWDSNGLNDPDSAQIEAFLVRVRGMANRIRVWRLDRPVPRGVATGTPIVAGSNQTGAQIATRGWTPNTAGLLLPGDMIGVGNELKMVTATVASDANGLALIPFEPELRSSPADASAIVTNRPTAKFMAQSAEVGWSAVPGLLVRGHTLDLIEDLTI